MTAIAATRELSFERANVRAGALLVLLVAAFLSPNIETVGAFPAVRLEQILLGLLLIPLAALVLGHPEYRRLGAVDVIFAALALAMTITIIVAPLIVDEVTWSMRDPFEVARVVEYWLCYRLALTVVPTEWTSRRVLALLGGMMALLGLFSLLQYLDGFGGNFNPYVTKYWATGHNLVGVERESRVVGTVGNANYYSMLAALPLIAGLALVLLRRELPGRWQWLALAGIVLGTLSMVMAQSRTAMVALVFALLVGLSVLVVSGRARARLREAPFVVLVVLGYLAVLAAIQALVEEQALLAGVLLALAMLVAAGLLLAMRGGSALLRGLSLWLLVLAASVSFVEARPPYVGTFHDRFSPFNLDDDTSALIRFQRLKSFFTGFFADEASICGGDGERIETLPVAKSHVMRAAGPGAPQATPDQLARDRQRKADVVLLSRGIIDYFCEKDRWPIDRPLTELVPEYLERIPVDPASGEAYRTYISQGGFFVGAPLENGNDPEGPVYTLGTIPNIIVNSSFESGKEEPSSWSPRTNVRARVVEGGLFQDRAARLEIGPLGDFRQFIVFDFNVDTEYTAAAWVRSANGEEQKIRLYIVGQVINGNEYDPLARETFTLPADGRWVRIELPFRTPPEASNRIITLQFMLRGETNESSALIDVDGATLTQGTFAPAYGRVTDVDPSRLRPQDLPQFADSPLVGVGPRNNAEAGAFDNEYALFLDRYGVLGTLPYLALYIAAAVIGFRAFRRGRERFEVLGLALFVFSMALFVFNLGAGSYYHFQIMAIYWLLIGYLAARGDGDASEPRGEPVPAAASARGRRAARGTVLAPPAGKETRA